MYNEREIVTTIKYVRSHTKTYTQVDQTLEGELPVLKQRQSLPRLLLDTCIILYTQLMAQRARTTTDHTPVEIAHMPQRRIEPSISQHLLTSRVLRQLKHARRSRSPHIDV